MTNLTETESLPPYKRLSQALDQGAPEIASEIITQASPEDQRRIFSQLNAETREELCLALPTLEIASLLEHLAEVQAIEILESIPAERAADIVEEMDAEISSDLLRELDDEETEAILSEIDDDEESQDLRERASSAADCAISLMSDQVHSFLLNASVRDVLEDLEKHAEKYSDSDVQYFYVVDSQKRLEGVLSLRDLVLSQRQVPIESLMRPKPLAVEVSTSLDDLKDLFEEKNYFGFPVVDEAGRLRGVVSRHSVDEAVAQHQTDDYLKASGIVGGEELRSMPLKQRCLRRLAWLGPNILLNLLAACVIATYEDTLQAAIALAVFLPMVSDMSGCSGNQAVAVSIRELTLGILQPRDFLRVIFKEGLLGITNGIVLGLVLGTIATLWKGSLFLGLVVGCALALNTILSVLLGGIIPLALKKFKADPALASGPILTTCTDMCGFFLVLSLASTALERL